MIRAAATTCLILLPGAVSGLPLDIPSPSVMTAERTETKGDAPIPLAPWSEAAPVAPVEGAVLHRAWRIGSPGLTTLQILAPLREQLQALGYEVLFECADADCGGFDFRYGLDLIGEPDMHVDLGDFRYLAAGNGLDDRVALVVSRSASAGFVHLTHVGVPGAAVAIAPPAATPLATGDLTDALDRAGRAVLDDLVFATGAAALGEGPFASLDALAAYMRDRPELGVVLVGHTDAEGSLDANIALSQRRAAAVAARLIEAHGVAEGRLRAEGVGYLVPLASNATPDGREANRRVEAILTHTE